MGEDLNKIVRAIGSFIFTCLLFACPISVALLIYTKHTRNIGFLFLMVVTIVEFVFLLFAIYFHSGED